MVSEPMSSSSKEIDSMAFSGIVSYRHRMYQQSGVGNSHETGASLFQVLCVDTKINRICQGTLRYST